MLVGVTERMLCVLKIDKLSGNQYGKPPYKQYVSALQILCYHYIIVSPLAHTASEIPPPPEDQTVEVECSLSIS